MARFTKHIGQKWRGLEFLHYSVEAASHNALLSMINKNWVFTQVSSMNSQLGSNKLKIAASDPT